MATRNINDPEDATVMRQIVQAALADARNRRYRHDMEAEASKLTLDQIRGKSTFEANSIKKTAGDQLLTQVEDRLASAVANRQMAENEIKVYEARLAALDNVKATEG